MKQLGPSGKIWKRLAAAFLAVALSSVFLAAWQVQRLRALAQSEVARVLGTAFEARASVRDVSVDWPRAGLVLRGIEVKRGERTLLEAAELHATPVLGGLLRGRLELRSVSIPAATVTARIDDLRAMDRTGERNLPDAITIEALNLTLELTSAAKPQAAVELRRAKLTIAAASGRVESFAVSSPTAAWRSEQARTTASAFSLTGQRDAHAWQFNGKGKGKGNAAVSNAAIAHGELDGSIALRGTVSPLQLVGKAQVTGRTPQLSAASDVTLDTSGVRLDSLRIALGSSQFIGHAVLGLLDSSFEVRGHDVDLAHVGALWGVPIAGRGEVQLAGQGDAIRANLALEGLPLSELYRLLGAADDPVLSRLQGRAAGTAELQYSTAAGSPIDVTLTLQLADIVLAGYPLDRGSVSARISMPDRSLGLRGGSLRLSELSLGAASGKLALSGTMLRGLVDMQLSARGLPLERSPWLRGSTRTLLTGRIDGQGKLHGDASNILGDLQLGVDDLRLLGEPLGRIQVQALLRPSSATSRAQLCPVSRSALASGAFRGASAWLFCGGGWNDRLRIDLALGNDAARPIRGEVSLADFALGPALRGLQPSAADAIGPGTLSATLALEGGGLAAPEQLSGALRVRKLVLSSGDSRVENAAAFELRSRAGVLTLDGAKLEGPVHHYALSAGGSLGKTARLIADGQVGASTFTRASEPVVKAFGDIGVHLEWAPGADDALRGYAELRDLAIRGPATLEARHLRGRLRLAGHRLQLEGVEAELGSGKVGIAGHLDVAGVRVTAYDLAIAAERVAFEPEPLVRIGLDASTRLEWRGASSLPGLTGKLIVRHLAYGKPLHLEALAAMNRSRPGPPTRDRVTLDLTVEQRETFRVRNMLLDGELAIAGAERRLRVVGTDQRFGVLGALAVTRGRILFQGDQFHFTRGDIALKDPARVAPQFDVRAVADQPRRKDTSVVLTAQGTRDAFKVAVQCEAGEAAVEAPPFTCNYAHDRMACDDFDRLVAQWSCPVKHAAKASTPAR